MGNCNCTLSVAAALVGFLLGAVIVGFAIFFTHMTLAMTVRLGSTVDEQLKNDQEDEAGTE